MTPDRAQHASLQSVLRWAYYGISVDGETVRGAGFVRFMAKDKRDRDDSKKARPNRPPAEDLERRPRGFDAAAQSGLIKSWFEKRLTEEERLHLVAAFLMGRERARARQRLTTIVMRQVNLPFLKRGLAYRLVQKYYGKRGIVLKDLSERFNTGRHHMEIANRQIYMMLDALEGRAEAKAYEYLQGGNVMA